MKLKLARTTLKAKPKLIELSKIEEQLSDKSIFYFDKDNTHKEIMALIEYFEERDNSVYMREIKYGLNEGEYTYEVHIVE
ncbi:MAG TPA: hypothetical protein EYG98_02165 [Sulfurovum sp.]|nr:hypothetical protein [Sulfurovum sp.]